MIFIINFLKFEENFKFKGIYNALKSGCVDLQVSKPHELKSYLEKVFMEECRHVLVIGLDNEIGDFVSIDDAQKIVSCA